MPLSPYACAPEASLGRAVAEDESELRSVYQRDRDRIVHSIPFRRLEYKTQVFVNFEGDHFRTRLTHSLEVAQIARAMARALRRRRGSGRGDRAGARSRPQRLRPCRRGGARRGAGRLRRLRPQPADLPHRHPPGATLCRLRRAQPDLRDPGRAGEAPWAGRRRRCRRPWPSTRWRRGWTLRLQPPLEAQLAAIADDVAYTNHDLDDGLRAGFFALDELAAAAAGRRAPWPRSTGRYPGLEAPRRVHETIRRLIDGMVRDLIDGGAPAAGRAARRLARTISGAAAGAVVAFSPAGRRRARRAARVLARPRLSPLQGQPHDAQGAARGARAGRRPAAGAGLPAGRLARARRASPTRRPPPPPYGTTSPA